MPRETTGLVITNGDGSRSTRVRVGPVARPRFRLAMRDEDAASERAKLLVRLASSLRKAAGPAETEMLLEYVAAATTENGLAEAVGACEDVASGLVKSSASAISPTFAKFAEEWTSGDLRRDHRDHVREKDHARDEELLRLHINPHIGHDRIADVTLAHCERVMRALPGELAPATRRHVAQCMRKVLSLAVYPGKHRTSNPIPREWMPKVPKSESKAKACLWPAEDAQLMRCKAVSLDRRIAYGILVREGMRASELERLKWRDIDEHGRVRLDVNKTSDPRAWALSPDVARTLAWWKKRTKGGDGDLVLGLDLGDGAWWLRGDAGWTEGDATKKRGDLRTAGVARAELFERSKSRQPLRLHDLRATFVTVSLANGKTEQWVTDRTGHRSSQMLALYTRQARTWAELGMGTLEPLDDLLPEVVKARGGGGSGRSGGSERRRSPSRAPAAPKAILARDVIVARERPPPRMDREWTADGGPSGTRTRDLRIKSPQLYRLSYRP